MEGDPPVTAVVSARMAKIRSKDTRPEMLLRRELHRRGLRYRVGVRPLPALPRTGDLVFPSAKVVVMVDGCFWHRCPEHYRPSTARADFWESKINTNTQRDIETNERLREAGWHVERVWEHEAVGIAADRIEALVRTLRSSTGR